MVGRRASATAATVGVLVLVLGLVAAGCGVRSDVSSQAAPSVQVVASAGFLADTAERTADAGTGRFEMSMTLAGLPGAADGVPLTITGSYDTDAKRAAMTMDMSGLAGLLEGAEDAPERAPDLSSMFSGAIDMVVDGTVVYLRMPLFAETLQQDRSWVKVDAAAAAGLGGGGGGPLPVAPGSIDPSTFLDYLRGVTEVTTVGPDEVRGVATTHLTARLSFDDLLSQVPEADRDRVRSGIDALGLSGQAITVPIDVWVDEQGRARRMAMSWTDPEGTSSAGVELSVDWFAFGEPVEIAVPTPDQVVDLGAN